MSVVLVEAPTDPASRGIARALRQRPGWSDTGAAFDGRPVLARRLPAEVFLVTIDGVHVHAEGLDRRLPEAGVQADAIVFLSRHRSQSGRPTLTAHPLGNFGAADVGGEPGRLTPSPGPLLTHVLRALRTSRDRHGFDAEVSFEATHHGPRLDTPALFAELGSTDQEWNDPRGHDVVADALWDALHTPIPSFPTVVGLGGGHYAPRFTEAALTKQVHFAHVLPTHHATSIDPAPMAAALARASPGATGSYYHDGTLPKPVRDAWRQALTAAGLPPTESRTWQPLA